MGWEELTFLPPWRSSQGNCVAVQVPRAGRGPQGFAFSDQIIVGICSQLHVIMIFWWAYVFKPSRGFTLSRIQLFYLQNGHDDATGPCFPGVTVSKLEGDKTTW